MTIAYVDAPAGPIGGDDGVGNGSEGQPYATVAHALSQGGTDIRIYSGRHTIGTTHLTASTGANYTFSCPVGYEKNATLTGPDNANAYIIRMSGNAQATFRDINLDAFTGRSLASNQGLVLASTADCDGAILTMDNVDVNFTTTQPAGFVVAISATGALTPFAQVNINNVTIDGSAIDDLRGGFLFNGVADINVTGDVGIEYDGHGYVFRWYNECPNISATRISGQDSGGSDFENVVWQSAASNTNGAIAHFQEIISDKAKGAVVDIKGGSAANPLELRIDRITQLTPNADTGSDGVLVERYVDGGWIRNANIVCQGVAISLSNDRSTNNDGGVANFLVEDVVLDAQDAGLAHGLLVGNNSTDVTVRRADVTGAKHAWVDKGTRTRDEDCTFRGGNRNSYYGKGSMDSTSVNATIIHNDAAGNAIELGENILPNAAGTNYVFGFTMTGHQATVTDGALYNITAGGITGTDTVIDAGCYVVEAPGVWSTNFFGQTASSLADIQSLWVSQYDAGSTNDQGSQEGPCVSGGQDGWWPWIEAIA